MTQDMKLVTEMRACVARWKGLFRFWIIFHFGIGVVAVLAPLAISTGAQSWLGDGMLALVAAGAAALVTFVRPDKYAFGYFAAYSHLEITLKRFQYAPEPELDNSALIDAFEVSRAHISNVQPARVSNTKP